MPSWEQTLAWLREPYNQTALVLLQIAGAVATFALIAGLASAVHNWRRRRRLREAPAQAQSQVDAQSASIQTPNGPDPTPEIDPKDAYAAILRLTPDDPRARKGLGR